MTRIRVISHRGHGAGPLENTLQAIREGIAAGADGVEIDVHASRDGEIVVIHDAQLDRTTDGTGFVEQRTLAELKGFTIGNQETIPTLQEAIDVIKDLSDFIVNIDIKPPNIEQQVLDIIQWNDVQERFWISSKIYSALRVMRALEDTIYTGLIYDYPIDDPIQLAQRNGVSALHPELRFVSADLVIRCHDAGLEINPWNVNEEQDMQSVIEWDVDNIITDYPARLRRILDEEGT